MTNPPQRLIFAAPPDFHWDDQPSEFPADVARMKSCLLTAGYDVPDDDIVLSYRAHSNLVHAEWLSLPEEDEQLVAILLHYLSPPPEAARLVFNDFGDGSDDAFLEFTDDFMRRMGWKIGDELEVISVSWRKIVLARSKPGGN